MEQKRLRLVDAVRLAEDPERLAKLTDEDLVELTRTLQQIEMWLSDVRAEYRTTYERELTGFARSFGPAVPLGLDRSDEGPPPPKALNRTETRVGEALRRVVEHIRDRAATRAEADAWAHAGHELGAVMVDTVERDRDS